MGKPWAQLTEYERGELMKQKRIREMSQARERGIVVNSIWRDAVALTLLNLKHSPCDDTAHLLKKNLEFMLEQYTWFATEGYDSMIGRLHERVAGVEFDIAADMTGG